MSVNPEIIKANLKLIMEENGWSQTQLGEKLGGAAKATVSGWLSTEKSNSTTLPDIVRLFELQDAAGFSLDNLRFPELNKHNSDGFVRTDPLEHDKYIGNYILAYISTNDISSANSSVSPVRPTELSAGILSVVRVNSVNDQKPRYRAFAKFSLSTEAAAIEKKKLDKLSDDHSKIAEAYLVSDYYYEGAFELIKDNRFTCISLRGYQLRAEGSNTNAPKKKYLCDRALISIFNPSGSKKNRLYIGGRGLSTSISRGRRPSPCSQNIIISRATIDDPAEILVELKKSVRRPDIGAIKHDLYLKIQDAYQTANLSDVSKRFIIQGHIEEVFDKFLSSYLNQILYVLDSEDDEFYDLLKSKEE